MEVYNSDKRFINASPSGASAALTMGGSLPLVMALCSTSHQQWTLSDWRRISYFGALSLYVLFGAGLAGAKGASDCCWALCDVMD